MGDGNVNHDDLALEVAGALGYKFQSEGDVDWDGW